MHALVRPGPRDRKHVQPHTRTRTHTYTYSHINVVMRMHMHTHVACFVRACSHTHIHTCTTQPRSRHMHTVMQSHTCTHIQPWSCTHEQPHTCTPLYTHAGTRSCPLRHALRVTRSPTREAGELPPAPRRPWPVRRRPLTAPRRQPRGASGGQDALPEPRPGCSYGLVRLTADFLPRLTGRGSCLEADTAQTQLRALSRVLPPLFLLEKNSGRLVKMFTLFYLFVPVLTF